jgi:DNA-binding transcriptional MerR regulator
MEVPTRIPEKLFFRIGEVCDLIKVQPHVLRYWETEFPMLTPQKNRAGQRVYRKKDVEMVMKIRTLLYEEKFTIAGAKKRLQEEMHKASPRMKSEIRQAEVAEETAEQAPDGMPSNYDATEQFAIPAALPARGPAVASDVSYGHSAPVEAPTPSLSVSGDSFLTPQARRAIRLVRHNLEDLLTLLNADASIKR